MYCLTEFKNVRKNVDILYKYFDSRIDTVPASSITWYSDSLQE